LATTATIATIPTITAIAGVNGAGKSSVAGGFIRSRGGAYFNPDEQAAKLRAENPALSQEDANSRAWHDGRRLLEQAIAKKHDFVFETTLGGTTITRLLQKAAAEGLAVRVAFVGLESAAKHIERVKARVARGGHDIPPDTIRRRFRESRVNLVRLLPSLDELVVFDNSDDIDPAEGAAPKPKRLLHWKRRIAHIETKLDEKREWAKPILAAALELAEKGAGAR
jgi:predicted ABC-type ATPase